MFQIVLSGYRKLGLKSSLKRYATRQTNSDASSSAN